MSRSQRSSGDQIEFLPPNDAAFGVSGGADFVGFDDVDDPDFGDEGPRSRWLPAVASTVVLGLLAGGIIAAAPWDEGATATPPTTTTPATTTSVAATSVTTPSTTERVLDPASAGPPGFVLDDPGQFQLSGAWTTGSGARPTGAYADDMFELWTTPDATRTTGRWLAVSTQHERDNFGQIWPNATRLTVGQKNAVLMSYDDGVSRMSFVAADGAAFEIEGFGFSLADLMTVANGVSSGDDDNTIHYDDPLIPEVLAGLTMTVSQMVPYGGLEPYNLLAQPQSGVYYIAPDQGSSLQLAVMQPTDVDAAVYQFLMQPVTELTPADRATLATFCAARACVGPVHVSQYPDSSGPNMLTWTDTRGPVTIASYQVPVSTLIELLPQVRLTEPFEWADLVLRTNEGKIQPVQVNTPQPLPTEIGGMEPGTNVPFWGAQIVPTSRFTIYLNTNSSGWGGVVIPSTTPIAQHYASSSLTFVVGTASFPSTARTMRVTLQGLPAVDVPMVQVGDTPVYAGAYAYTEMLPDTVEFLDLAGNVVTE